jgi:hypothetical protein
MSSVVCVDKANVFVSLDLVEHFAKEGECIGIAVLKRRAGRRSS